MSLLSSITCFENSFIIISLGDNISIKNLLRYLTSSTNCFHSSKVNDAIRAKFIICFQAGINSSSKSDGDDDNVVLFFNDFFDVFLFRRSLKLKDPGQTIFPQCYLNYFQTL